VNGLLASVKDARSNLTQFTFDGFDRPNQTTYADSSFEQNVLYDANGNVLTARTRAGNQIINTFDALNRLSTKAPASEPTVTFGYDLASRLLSATKPTVTGDPSSGAFSRLYDTAGRFYTESYPDGKQVVFGLDSNGNRTKLTYPDGYFVTRSYDQLNRLSNIFLNGAATAAAALTYDQLSRRTALTYNNGASSSYGYTSPIVDDLTSIAHAFVGSSVTFGYTYNNDHEITVQSLSDNTYEWFPTVANVTYAAANAVNEYPTVGGTTYSYNGDGCLTSDGVLTLGYDTEDHLTSASKTGTSVSYVYDGFHRQAQKSATIGGTTAKSRYIYSGWQRIADYDGTAGTLQNRYVYADGLDEPLMQVSSAGVVTYLHANAQGSVIGVSNSAGAVTNKNVYGTFGETSALAGTTFGFTSQRYDSDTGLYYYKNRYYSPTIGRFLQPDPAGYVAGLNLYSYVNNSPCIYTDPFGLTPVGDTASGQSGVSLAGFNADNSVLQGLNIAASGILFAASLRLSNYNYLIQGHTHQENINQAIKYAITERVKKLPVLILSAVVLPHIVKGIEAAVDAGYETTLHYAGKGVADISRRVNLRGLPGGTGLSYDEFPFASTIEGAKGVSAISQVPLLEQQRQGGIMSAFYKKHNLQPGDAFEVIIRK
jgi:RHS repeat-associated protein